MGCLPHPAGEGERTGRKPKKKHPVKSAEYTDRRWYACKQRRRRYYPANPVTYSHSEAQRYSVPGAKASHHRL